MALVPIAAEEDAVKSALMPPLLKRVLIGMLPKNVSRNIGLTKSN